MVKLKLKDKAPKSPTNSMVVHMIIHVYLNHMTN